MVRKYTRKYNRGDYSKETLHETVEEVKSERMVAYKSSKHLPLNTIMDHLKGRRCLKSETYGRSTAISMTGKKIGLLKVSWL